MKHVFIINPTAGKSDSRQKIYDMAEKLRQEHGLEVQCLLTKKQGQTAQTQSDFNSINPFAKNKYRFDNCI